MSNGLMVTWSPDTGQIFSAIPGLTNVTAISVGLTYRLALTDDGQVLAWGSGSGTTVPAEVTNVVAIASGSVNMALRNDNTMIAWPDPATYGIPATLSNVVAIDIYGGTALTLSKDGVVKRWTKSFSIPTSVTNAIAIACGNMHALAITNNGSPFMIRQPRSRNVLPGTDVTVDAAVVGPPTMNYQWYSNNVAIVDATNRQLFLPNMEAEDTGLYHLVASNPFGVVTSSIAAVTVVYAPLVTVQPPNPSVPMGTNTTLTAAAFGPEPITYQWRFNNSDIADATNALLQLTNVQPSGEGYFSVVASNFFGATTSAPVFLNVIDLPESLNATNLVWTTAGNLTWFPQTNFTHDGVASASSGPCDWSHWADLQTTVSGPGTLTYWWRIIGQSSDGALTLFSDGTNLASIGTSSGWQQKSIHLPPGDHALLWRMYDRLAFLAATGMVDHVTFTSELALVPKQWSQDGFSLQLYGLSGHGDIVIHGSTNLTDWSPILTNPPAVGSLELLDPQAADLPLRFYRIEER